MLELLLVIFAIVGLSHIIVDSTIFNRYVKTPLWNFVYKKNENGTFVVEQSGKKVLKKNTWFYRRLEELDEMLGCYQCSGFYSGVFVGVLWLVSGLDYFGWLKVLVYGLAGSYLSMLGATALIFLNTGANHESG